MQIYVLFSICAEKTIKKTVNSHINCYTQNNNYFERMSEKRGRRKKMEFTVRANSVESI